MYVLWYPQLLHWTILKILVIYCVRPEHLCNNILYSSPEYDEENPRSVTKCEHHFHLCCILEWMERSDTCPVCDQVSTETSIISSIPLIYILDMWRVYCCHLLYTMEFRSFFLYGNPFWKLNNKPSKVNIKHKHMDFICVTLFCKVFNFYISSFQFRPLG